MFAVTRWDNNYDCVAVVVSSFFFLQECIPNVFLVELQTLKHFERVLTTFCTPCPNIYNRNLLIPVITIDPLRLDLWEVG